MTNHNQNIDKAKEWFLKAAREGSYEALYKLGQMIEPNVESKSECVRIAINYYKIKKTSQFLTCLICILNFFFFIFSKDI